MDSQPQYQYPYSSCSSQSELYSSYYSSPTHMYPLDLPPSYHFPSQLCSPTTQSDCTPVPQLPLHAPVPLPYYSPFLPSVNYSTAPLQEPVYPTSSLNSHYQPPQQNIIMDLYANAPQQTFPTPSELLSELTTARQSTPAVEPKFEKKVDSQRRARRRATARNIGFQPTDPDSISSHDKKRHYLQSLEGYVVYLHEQLTLVGAKPLPLERVSTYRGLSSRSIRTLLIHMENTVKDLHAQTLDEEQAFLDLRKEAVDRDAAAAAAAEQDRRHSSPSCDTAQASRSHTFK